MALLLDPDAAEPRALFAATSLSGARLLEIGSGDGRLTFRCAGAAAFTVGIEREPEAVSSAVAARPAQVDAHLAFVLGAATTLPFRDASFDVALFGSSL